MSLDICSLTLADPVNSLQDGRKHVQETFLCLSSWLTSSQSESELLLPGHLAEHWEFQQPSRGKTLEQ